MKNLLRNLWKRVSIFGLFLKHLIRRRRLKVESVRMRELILYVGCHSNLEWKVDGCHKIVIVGYETIKGSRRNTSIQVTSSEPLILKFYGFNTYKEVEVRSHVRTVAVSTARTKMNISPDSLAYPFTRFPTLKSKTKSVIRAKSLKCEIPNQNINSVVVKNKPFPSFRQSGNSREI